MSGGSKFYFKKKKYLNFIGLMVIIMQGKRKILSPFFFFFLKRSVFMAERVLLFDIHNGQLYNLEVLDFVFFSHF